MNLPDVGHVTDTGLRHIGSAEELPCSALGVMLAVMGTPLDLDLSWALWHHVLLLHASMFELRG